ncbi:helix-turn-helix domain-containing protein [Candidatus Darwinibacter acetoxidans]|jgi:AbrB family looped-hinge helix DNA binding protein|nr:helix-turn-helix domain-containing protein [Limnochordia bacterium]MDI9464598.1 helix-turn-helix domain-containing protein [Bacillota bacterium]NLO94986.1 helix-turn-helix domain-containing protein [Bacillota bacterium]HAI52272.1 XRE family transcriptional regulator [Bacillota bacterium]HAN94971.1 XRE family transcriptional regulator [Bacillota bacterium]
MKSSKGNIADNLRYLRSRSGLTQEQVAEYIGVSRQAVAKWERGESLPDILNCEALADLFEVSLTDLVRHDAQKEGMPIPPRNKHIFGVVTLGERGQIVLPKKARDTLNLQPGDTLVVLGDTSPLTKGIALIASDVFLKMTGGVLTEIFPSKGD